MKIDIVVLDKRASVIGAPVIVCGNSDYSVEFAFDAEWAEATIKTARFMYVKSGALKYQDVVFSGNSVNVPILSDIREVLVGVYAGDLQTTTPAKISCQRSILCGTGVHDEPDPDVYNQLLGLLSTGLPEPALIVCESTGEVVSVADASNNMLRGLTLYGKTTQNGTPTPEAPVELVNAGASGAINTVVEGKNLLPKFVNNIGTGYSCVVAEDGTVTLNSDGGSSGDAYSGPSKRIKLPRGTYVLSGSPVGTSSIHCDLVAQRVAEDGTLTAIARCYNGNEPQFTLEEETTLNVWTRVRRDTTANNVVIKPMIRYASVTDGSYEPYKEAQTLTAQTPNGLHGIPVSSGGNYTDENGQRWICDEIDFARGVYVKRTTLLTAFTKISTNTNTERYNVAYGQELIGKTTVASICSVLSQNQYAWSTADMQHYYIDYSGSLSSVNVYVPIGFDNSNNKIKVLAALVTPIETPLSAEELTAYAALHTNKPNTTVYNDAGAGLKLAYNADTKTYIDNKFTELQNAILSAGANI